MVSNEDVVRLLTDIRDRQREQLALSRRAVEHAETQAKLAMDAAERSIANQQQSIATQAAGAKLYKRVTTVVLVVIALLVVLVLRLMFRYL
jgi:hypothetical protein